MTILKTLRVIPAIYKGRFTDIDQQIKEAYERYPFPWPNEKQYGQYTIEDIRQTMASFKGILGRFLEQFDLDLNFFKGKTVVDIGSGVGWDALCIAAHGAKCVYAIDNSHTSLEHGRRFAKMLGIENIQFCQRSLYELDGLGIKADVVLAKGVLHHIFDLSRFVKALTSISRKGTQLILAHSSFFSIAGLKHYFYNHLAWAVGGTDLEKRIDVGLKFFRGWHWQLTDTLVRHRVNDLSGVFYMARTSRQVIGIFKQGGFDVKKIQGQSFSSLYPFLKEHHKRMYEIEKSKMPRKIRRLMAIGLIQSFYVLSGIGRPIDRFLGPSFKFLFSKTAILLLAEKSS